MDLFAPGVSDGRSFVTDEGATRFDEFYRSEYRGALKLATLLVHDGQRAAELTQEVFVVALRRWSRLAGYDRPDLWLRRAVINRAISERRRRWSESKAIVRLAGARVAESAPVAESLGLWREVAELPRRQAEALVLVYGDDLSIEDAARAMHCSAGTVKTHLHRGRSALAQLLEEST